MIQRRVHMNHAQTGSRKNKDYRADHGNGFQWQQTLAYTIHWNIP
jgi:hypothetical protein